MLLMGKVITILAMLCLWRTLLYAQPGAYQFTRVDISQGLSHNQVNCILKDSKGFLWFGTMSGLNRYDGYRFKVFRHALNDSSSLNDDYIARMMEGPGGYIWVETRTGLIIYDPITEKFDRNTAAFLQRLSLPNVAITNILKDSKGNYWFLMAGQSLFRHSVTTGKTTLVYRATPATNGITSFAEADAGNIWLLHTNGVMEKIEAATGKTLQVSEALARAGRYEKLNYTLFTDAQHELWMFNTGDPRGIFHYTPATGVLQHINKDTGACRLNTNLVIGVLQDNKGRIWISTDHGGVNVLDKATGSMQYVVNNIDDNKSLAQNSITSAYKDNAGIIWLGTYKKGVSYYHENIIKFPLFRHQPSNPHSLGYDDVNRFVEDAKGNLWIGTNGGGLIYYERDKARFTRYVHNANDANSLSNDVIVSLCIDRRQKLWVGTYFGGLDCYDGHRFIHYKNDPANAGSLSDDRVWEIFEDSEQRLWVGTLSGGLDWLDREKNVFHHMRMGSPRSIHSDYIAALVEDKEGNLWIGTANGIDVLDKRSGGITYYNNVADNDKSISNNNIICILEDDSGMMWVGTRDGLNLFDKASKNFLSFRTGDGLPDNTVLNILEDKNHYLWISTPNGLSQIKVQRNENGKITIVCRNYDEMDGLQGTAFNENAALKTSAGELVFGGANGFNIFHPENITFGRSAPPLAFTDLQVFNKSVSIGEEINGRVVLNKAVSQTSDITLKYNDNVVTLEFAALNYSNTEKIKYAYMLEPFNKEWLVTDGRNRKATYTNLDPGDYVFRVKAANDDGSWNETGLSLKVKILPPFWKTPLAYLLYALFITGILLFARQIVLQRAKMRFEIQQQRSEAKRMHELDMMKIKFFTNVSHEFRTPLSLILTPLDKIIRHAEQPEQKKQFQLIHRNARRLLNLVNQLLDFRKMEVQELKLNPSQGDIMKFIREISWSFTDMAEKKNIAFSFHSGSESLPAFFDHDKLERILFNLLSNAFKFTPAHGQVSVDVQLRTTAGTPQLSIQVMDTGIGIPPEKQEKVFERFFQNDVPGSMVNQGSGIGLAITKEFVKLHQGTIDLRSEPGKGSCFTVMLPVKEAPAIQPAIAMVEEMAVEAHLHPAETETAHSNKKATILLVEDNEDFRFYLKDNLREHFNIIEAGNGKEGWQKALGHHPDLVVSDISMPEMTGTELCRKIKKDPRTSHLPVILLTALAGEEQQLKGLETGANDYMTKPFNFEILQSRIKNILEEQARLRKTFQKQIDVKPADISLASPDEQFIFQALEAVEKNISNPAFSVEEMSKIMCMSRVALYKKILALTGKTPIEFIRSIRLRRAAQLLEKSKMTVSEIAYEVGFNNPKYFARYFKAEFNVVPSAYINEKRKNGDSKFDTGLA
jgi:signal transduction histidine kinase/ligand-binding sensor domain-containing protein/AraC-like DNA-binding protein